ncbi:MAG: T9SS type A sorting domain-containing protein [Ignavibacteriales bacterium]|nr:MAG: T9SS type A sorting domain-containing protein [Ignavibacteriaceae bacterium]MBW7872529.1 T9SS type A sorting domain-containing protein [Ignavibacteria bacterium]MCZ2141918.1 T9SS type A sorting domain-containing protein [Ignavibacteriales bacterium]OQY79536.1 MAG: hypothetical protein B6D45_00670 [Ignavibacteriales bacterium UTCHB3]MBV6445084.1 hypothetical protein [Ignavibacteriaceae bacterium]
MRNRILSVIIFIAFFSLSAQAQLTRIVFKKWGNYHNLLGIKAGDQNGDGINDFWLGNHDSTGQGYLELYYGGDPIDTIPKMRLKCMVYLNAIKAASIDLNGDGYNDLILSESRLHELKVYFGGPLLDTIPDMVIPFPDTTAWSSLFYNSTNKWIDFDGDGVQELLVRYYYQESWHRPFLAFYKTGSEFTGEPYRICYLDTGYYTVDYYRYEVGDFNGDGCTDLFEYIKHPDDPDDKSLMVIYGNSDFNFDDRFVFKLYSDSVVSDFTEYTLAFPDMDGDGKDDFIHVNHITYQYPWYMDKKITTGGYPPFEYKLAWRAFNDQLRGSDARPLPSPGDFNGDGKPEFLGGTEFSEYLWLGGNPRTRDMVADQKFEGYMGRGLIGDVTGDGVDDFITSTITNRYVTQPGFAVIFAGDRTFVSVKDEAEQSVPESVKIEAYPNPFNPSTKLSYTVPSTGWVTLSIYNISGELMVQRDLGEKYAGSYEEEINLGKTGAASGVYFAEITFVSGSDVKKEKVKLQLLK